MDMTHERALLSIDRHFSGRVDVREEAELRAHLPDCDTCRARYERQLLLERLTNRGRGAKQRLARGLGLRVASEAPVWPRWAAALTAATATTLALLVLVRPGESSSPAFGTRSGSAASAPVLLVYRMLPGGAPVRAQGRISRDDELAFAYSNPGAKKHVWIFGVDEHRHVYWYYPAWPEGTPAPPPFAAQLGPGPHELPDAVRHDFDGSRLELYSLLSDEPISIAEIEARIATSDSFELPRTTAVHQSLELGEVTP
jgi:hypothetical protein